MDDQIDPSGIDDAHDIEVVRAVEALWHPVDNPSPAPSRNDVEAVLLRLANGGQYTDDLWFVQELARCLLAAGGRGMAAEDRANNVLKACGLHGKYDEDRNAVRTMQTIREFGGSVSEAINFARGVGAIGPTVSDETAKKKLKPRGRR